MQLESNSHGGSPKIAIGRYQLLKAERPIQSTGVGQDPHLGAAKPDRLFAPIDCSRRKMAAKASLPRNAR